MTKKLSDQTAQNPLILRFHRLMDAFAKSDDERDFYLDKVEGFLVFLDLNKTNEDIEKAEAALNVDKDRFRLIPKMTFYETKKFMEGFVNEKVYDIDTKEKLLDIISSKEARENFLEFIYDHLTELEKWQQYYHERSRIRIIEWLRDNEFTFVFEEDLELSKTVVDKLKQGLFVVKVPKEIATARDTLNQKARTYYSNEALNPRPKRGRPPKQIAKVEVEPQLTADVFTTVPPHLTHFLFIPEYSASAALFSSKFDTEAQLIASLRGSSRARVDTKLEALSLRLESLRHLSDRLKHTDGLGIGKEEALIDAVSKTDFSAKVQGEEKGSKVMSFAKGLLPGKKDPAKPDYHELAAKKRKAGIKQVTQIKKKKSK